MFLGEKKIFLMLSIDLGFMVLFTCSHHGLKIWMKILKIGTSYI